MRKETGSGEISLPFAKRPRSEKRGYAWRQASYRQVEVRKIRQLAKQRTSYYLLSNIGNSSNSGNRRVATKLSVLFKAGSHTNGERLEYRRAPGIHQMTNLAAIRSAAVYTNLRLPRERLLQLDCL